HFLGGRFHINRARYIDPAMADKNTQLFHIMSQRTTLMPDSLGPPHSWNIGIMEYCKRKSKTISLSYVF
ncbi:MAG: hypothetical protein Q7V12_10370, partial [Deltaproteobacteria bacterium]|nr:hypothetical protein [Deltaproteobacteria bacterium]